MSDERGDPRTGRPNLVTAVLTVFLALAVVTMPAAAAHQVVVSIHTDDTDFNNAATLSGVSVTGSGSSASVDLKNDDGTDGFESGSLSSYGGDSGMFSIATSPVFDGQYSLYSGYSDPRSYISDTDQTVSNGTSFTYRVYHDSGVGSSHFYFGTQSESSTETGYRVRIANGGNLYLDRMDSGSSTQLASASASAPENQWMRGEIDWGSGGGITVTLYDASGSQLAQVSATDTNYTSGGVGYGNYKVNTYFDAKDVPEGTYIGANHTADYVQQGFTNLTLSNANATVTWQGSSGSGWTDLNTVEYSTGGNKTVALSSSYDKYRVNVTFTEEALDRSGTLEDEGVVADTHSPAVNNSTADPSGNEKVTSRPVTLSINVSDADFSTPQSDQVTVDFYVNGSKVGSDVLTSNGTASYDYEPEVGGTLQWHAEANDEYSHSQTSDTFYFETPSVLHIRNVSNTSELVDSPVEVTVRFYGSGTIVTRTSSDGTVSLSGLPTDNFIVEVKASEQYHSRTVYIQSLYTQSSVYLLNNSFASVESRFVLEDPTGNFPPESIVYIQKPINQSGSTEFRTVHADRFGVEGVTADLEKNARYRIKIQSPDGTVQDIGPYRSDVGETVTVRPGAPTINLGEYTDGWAANATIDNTTLEFAYSDPEGNTSELTVWVHEKGNKSNKLGTNRTFVELGNASGTYTLSANQSEKTWVVNFIVEREGEKFTTQKVVSNNPNLVPDLSREWRLIAGIGILLISAGVFSLLNAGVGGVVVAIEGGVLWWSGWLEGATIGVAVIMALFVAVLFHVYSSGSPG